MEDKQNENKQEIREPKQESKTKQENTSINAYEIDIPEIVGNFTAKAELLEQLFVTWQYAEEMRRMGVERSAGVLLYGVPGTGKTELAKQSAILYAKKIGPEKVKLYTLEGKHYMGGRVGSSTKKISEIFDAMHQLKEQVVVVINEIELLVPKRGSLAMEKERTNAMINSGFREHSNLFIIGTTNRPELIDIAILRTGRLVPILCSIPNFDDRIELAHMYLKDLGVLTILNTNEIAELTALWVGANFNYLRTKIYLMKKRKEAMKERITKSDIIDAIKQVTNVTTIKSLREISKFETMYREIEMGKGKVTDEQLTKLPGKEPGKKHEIKFEQL